MVNKKNVPWSYGQMKTIIHAGLYKTATTALQTFLFQNRDTLKKNGIYVPLEFSRKNYLARDYNNRAHHLLYHQLCKQDDKLNAKLKSEIRNIRSAAAAAGCHTIFYSTELFSESDSAAFDCIERDLFECKIQLIYTIRNVHEIAESYNNQILKTSVHSFYSLASLKKKNFRAGYILRALADVAEKRGANRVTILEFKSSNVKRLLEDFCSYLGVKIEDLGAPNFEKNNASITWEGYWKMQRLLIQNKKIQTATGRDRRRILLNLNEKISRQRSRVRTQLVTLDLKDQEKVSEVNANDLKRIRRIFPVIDPKHVLLPDELARFYRRKYCKKNVQRRPSLINYIRNMMDEKHRTSGAKRVK